MPAQGMQWRCWTALVGFCIPVPVSFSSWHWCPRDGVAGAAVAVPIWLSFWSSPSSIPWKHTEVAPVFLPGLVRPLWNLLEPSGTFWSPLGAALLSPHRGPWGRPLGSDTQLGVVTARAGGSAPASGGKGIGQLVLVLGQELGSSLSLLAAGDHSHVPVASPGTAQERWRPSALCFQ